MDTLINTSGMGPTNQGMATVIWSTTSEAEAKRDPNASTSTNSDSGMSSHDNSPRASMTPSPGGSLIIDDHEDHDDSSHLETKRRRSAEEAPPRSHSLDHYHETALARQHRLLSSLLPGITGNSAFNTSNSAFHPTNSAFHPVITSAANQHRDHPNNQHPFLPGIFSNPLALLPPLPLAGAMPQPSNTVTAQQLTPPMKHAESIESLVSIGSESTPQKKGHVRPFKAYNPQDPLSALQLSANSPQTSTTNELLLAQYKQFINHHKNNKAATNTPSPPQVTSTSHPHTDGSLTPRKPTLSDFTIGSPHLPVCQPVNRPLTKPVSQSSSVTTASHPQSVIVSHQNTANHHSSVNHQSTTSTTSSASSGHTAGGHPAQAQQKKLAPVQNLNSSILMPNSVKLEDIDGKDGAGSETTSSGRAKGKSLPDEQKDEAYWERRRKNNEAAKRSRDARRCKEDEIAMRAALLEQENLRLRIELAQLKQDCEKMRAMLLNV